MLEALRTTTHEDLREWVADLLEVAYHDRDTDNSRGSRCSRVDFAAGFVAGLIVTGHMESFR